MKKALRIPLLAACLLVAGADAATIVIGNGPGRLIVQIGTSGGTVNEVDFSVPGASVGSGTAVTSSAIVPASPTCPANTVLIDVQARSQRNRQRVATLSADSSIPLSSGTSTIPFTQVSWTTSTPGGSACLNAPTTIPSGTFTGSAGQPLISFTTSRRACACAQFTYLNQSIVSAGTYTGRVKYTLAMP